MRESYAVKGGEYQISDSVWSIVLSEGRSLFNWQSVFGYSKKRESERERRKSHDVRRRRRRGQDFQRASFLKKPEKTS